MEQISFMTSNREVITFVIEGKTVKYHDRNWKQGIQIMPLNKDLVKSLLKSRSQMMQATGLLISDANMGKNLEEYESAKGEKDLLEIIRKDSLSKGLMEIKQK